MMTLRLSLLELSWAPSGIACARTDVLDAPEGLMMVICIASGAVDRNGAGHTGCSVESSGWDISGRFAPGVTALRMYGPLPVR